MFDAFHEGMKDEYCHNDFRGSRVMEKPETRLQSPEFFDDLETKRRSTYWDWSSLRLI